MKNFNLIEMLRGCSKRSGTTFRQSNPDGQPTVNRQSRLMSHQGYLRNLAMLFAVLVMSIGQMWGASPLTVDAPSQNFYTQDGVTIAADPASYKINNVTSQAVFTTYDSASIYIYSQLTNITGISFKAAYKGSGSATSSFSLYASTGGAFAVPSSGVTATKDGNTLASLTNISLNGEAGSENTISVTFSSPVKAIILPTGSKSINVRNLSVSYDTGTQPSTYYAAHISGANIGTIDTDPGSASTTVATNSGQVTVGGKTFWKLNSGGITIDLGSGHTFSAGDQIVVEFAGAGKNKASSVVVNTGSGTAVATYNAGKIGTSFSSRYFYVVQASDGIQGQQTAKITGGTDTRFYSYSVLRAADDCDEVDEPTSLSCTAHTQTSLTFGWTKASNASGYVAKLWDNSSCTGDAVATENIANGNTETVTFSGLTAGTTYYCNVQSKGDGTDYCAEGGTTSAANGTTDACTAISPTWSYPFSTVAVGITIYPTIGGNTGEGAVTYTSNNTSYIKVYDATPYLPYGYAAGSATITANVAASGVYCSGSVTSGTITVVSDQSGLIKQTLTTGESAWGTPSAPATTDETNITSTTVLSATNLTISGNGNTSNAGQTAKITGMTDGSEGDNSSKYMQMGFTVKSGKQLNVSAIYIPVQPVSSDANNFKAVLSDGETTITGTLTNSKNGKLAYIKFDSYGTVKGNVTLTLYAWGWTGGYRLGKSIVIDGKIEDAASSCSDDTGLAYGTGTVDKTYGDAVFTNTLTNPNSLSVTYSSTNTDVATVNSSTGAVTIKAAGTTTIKATWAGDGTYCADEVSYTLNVKPSAVVDATNTNGWRYTIGDKIDLTCTPTGGSSYTYQWQKYTGPDTWTNLSNGTDGGTFSGVTTNRLQISGCTSSNGGSYRCVVTSGGQSKESNAYTVYIFTLNGNYDDDSWTENAIVWTGANTGRATINLAASRTYKFKVTNNDGKWFGCNTGVTIDMSNWTFRTNEGDCVLTTGGYGGGAYTFDIDISYAGDNNISVSVTYPKKTTYMQLCSDWKAASAKYAIYYWKSTYDGWTDFMTAFACDGDILSAEVPVWATNAFFVRFDPAKTSTGNFDDEWNRSGDNESTLPTDGKDYYNSLSKGGNGQYYGSWGTYSAPTYTVTTAVSPAGYGTVSAASVTGVACGTSISASTSTLTVGATTVTASPADATAEYTYAFDNWSWSPSGATVTSAVTATANFTRTPKSYTLTWTTDGDALTGDYTKGTVAYGTAIVQPNTPTKTGYTFAGWSSSVASTMPAANTTYTATWAAKTTTITINANTANHGSTAPSSITATYGSELPSFTAATGASGYSLTGYFTEATSGTKVINADGSLVANTDYADGSGNWKYETATLTLYAQYEEEGGGGDCEYSVVAAAVLSGTTTTSTLTGGTLLAEGLNGSGPYKLKSTPSWFGMKLSNNLQEGDSIIFKVKVGDWWAGASASTVPIVVFAGKSLDKEIYRTSAITSATDNYYVRFKVTQTMIDSYGLTDTVMIWRTETNKDGCTECCTQNHQMYSMQVKHCTPSCSTPSAPTATSNGATTYNTQAVSWTDASNEKWDVIVSESSSTPDAGDIPTASDLTSKSYTFTDLTASTEYHWWVRSVCDASHKSAWVAGSSFTTSAAPTLYTVTFNSNGGSAVSPIEQASEGASITLPTPTKSGYTFQGWYTSGGTKAGDGGDSYTPGADITLYAQWRENCVGTATTLEDINFKDAAWSDKTFNQGNTNDEDEINGVYFWAKDATKHFSLEDNTSNGLTFPNNNMSSGTYYFCIPITGINSSNKQITVTLKHGYSSAQAEYKWAYVDGRTSFSDGNTGGSGGTKVQDASKASTEITFTLNNSGKGLTNTDGHLFIGRSSSSYTNIYGVTVTTPGAAGTCYYVTYNGNGATGGYTTDEAAYASGDEATAATNSFTKTGYTFGGWATSKANADAGTKTYDEGADISITGNITLYAIWQAAGYTLAWDSNDGSALSGDYSSGSISDGATITAPNDPTRANYTFDSWNTAADGSGSAYTGTMPAANTTYYAVWKNTLTLQTGSQGSESNKSPTVFLDGSSLNGFSAHKAAGYTLQGYYTAATGGTKVLNADGSFAASNIARFVTSGKWSRTTGDTILVAQWESSYLLKWNLQLNKEEDAISTTSKESATARVTTASMTNLTNNGGLTITGSKKSDLTSKIETPINLSGAESKYMSVSFDVTAGYQLLPSAVKVMVQPVGDGENKYAKLILEDENSHSISTVVTCEGTEKGKKTTVTLSNAGGTVFTGTVTLKILVYNASGESTTNNCYRLGSPIQIDGAIEAACDLPSYEGLEYDQTEYTVGVDEASAIRVTGGSADTYQWKWNSTNDRSTGTVVGTNNASYTPLITISEVGTRYYWCELKNDDCDGVVKTPVVAVTVSSAVTATTVTWSDPENEPNYGGGGYVIRATVDQTEWGGTLGESNLVAPAGIHITNVATGTDDGKQYIEATFDVTTAFDRDENEVIVFGLTHDAVTGYSAISVTDTIDYDACSGGEEGSAAIALTSAIHDEGSGNAPRYWFETIGVGRVFGLNYGKATLGTSSDDTFNTEGYSYVASSTSQRWVFQPYVEGVTKIRIYIKSATNTLRVLSIGKNASWQDQSSKYSNIAVDTIIYSNGKTTGLDNNQKGYAEIQFSSALTKDNYYMFTMSSSSTYIYGVTLYSGSVGDGGNLATSLTFADPGPIDADASTANFQNIASKSGENSNTLGTITYSSNNDAATVNATTGEVSIHAKETAQVVTITATLSASGCYQGATATYTINVAADACDEPSGSIELTSGSATKCSGESVILTMTGFASGATVEWYNGDTKVNGESGYTIVTSGSTSTLETSNAGTYSAIAKVDGGCPSGAGRTNSITISNIAVDASATKIVDKWYVKNGRLTPDIALWQLSEGATLDEVTIVRNVSGEGSLGLTSSDFVARDGIVYLSGKEPSANETGADIEYTLTLTVKDACDGEHEMTEKTITLTHQKNTDKHVLAFVVNGTAKGGFTDGITAAQTTSVGLYNAIAAQFDVLATNIYATDDEKKLREYYSQFDILCITDYPNTQTKGANSKSYVDAIGSLIDIRPILTMEAFVSKLANWKAKGISGNPKSPTTRQYTMDLQCKDHEIFAGTKLTKVGEGDEAMYRVSMVDNTLEDYATLDATYGAILPHKEKESKSGAGDGEYNYGGKPALQGFTFTQEMIDNDLLPIGLIEDGAGNPLQVGIERQHNMEARLMVLGINSYAMERLHEDGERIVINALKYLMKKSYEDIADCSTAFVGGAEGDTKNWGNADNWTGNTVPLPSQKVRILAECEVSSTVHALDVLIVTDGKYNHGSDDAAGKLTIKENGALIVGGKIQAASAPAYNRPRATTPDKLLIETSSTNQAALIFDNEEAETQATVNLYSLGRKPSSYQYQYFAVPMEVVPVNPTFANETHGGTGIYTYVYSEATSGWTRRKYYDDLFAFEGLGITTKSPDAMNYTMTGNLASTATKEITLTHNGAGLNLIGNSWMAPIQIGALAEDNTDANITQTVYIYCAGRDAEGGAVVSSDDTETAGQWLAVPFEAAEFETWKEAGKLSVIPAMQAFQIKVDAEATLTLDYNKVVRGSTNDLNAKLRAPGRRMAANEVTMTNIRVADSKTHTDLSLFEGDRFSEAFDNGWEAEYMSGDGRSAKLYAETEAGQMAVAAMYDYEGTVVGFAPGKEMEYTFSFMGEDNGYYLNDIKLQNSVRISEGETYTFTYEEGDTENRFYISRTPIDAPQTSTGVDNTGSGEVKARKFIYRDKMYILINGRVYSADGALVK